MLTQLVSPEKENIVINDNLIKNAEFSFRVLVANGVGVVPSESITFCELSH